MDKLKTVLAENSFIVPSYQIYNGMAGYHDYGVLGVKVKQNLITIWRKMFINNGIHEIETPTTMPFDLLKASGHVERFTDFVVYDKDGKCFRADHLVENWCFENDMEKVAKRVETMDRDLLEQFINKYKVVEGPFDKELKKNLPVKVVTKNLMFPVASNGVHGDIDFLRPELAQGLFVNFNHIKSFLKTDKPFGIAQVGRAYRNEITPKPLTRMREFFQAEIEYFCDPKDRSHSGFSDVEDLIIPVLSQDMQKNKEDVKHTSIKEAVVNGIIKSELFGYFLGKIYRFALEIGLNKDKIRFREHLPHEMAHYAVSCWDLETLIGQSWLECVGCANRGCYDLEAHKDKAESKLRRKLDEPMYKTRYLAKIDKRAVVIKHKSNTQPVVNYITNLNQTDLIGLKTKLDVDGCSYACIEGVLFGLTPDMVQVVVNTETVEFEDYTPHVLEPSFGIDRLLYSVFAHNYWIRDGTRRPVLSLPKTVTPHLFGVFSLWNRDDMDDIKGIVVTQIEKLGYTVFRDDSTVKIGKKYVRADVVGVRWCFTVDPGSVKDRMVTVRDRDSMEQVRIPVDDVVDYVQKLM